MSADLLWPGLHRAGPLFDDAAVLAAMLRVEAAWLAALESAGIAPAGTAAAVAAFPVEHLDREALAVSAEAGGNPVIPLLAALRQGLAADAPQAAELVHRGLTSQDVLDTALVLCAGSCLDALAADLDALVEATAQLAERHRGTLLAARTLGQHAVPTTFGARAAGWCAGLLAARDGVRHTRAALRVQAGGAAGTMARAVEMCRAAGSPDAVADTERLVERLARELGLRVSRPWHTVRHPVTEIGDVLLAVSDALRHVATVFVNRTGRITAKIELLNGCPVLAEQMLALVDMLLKRLARIKANLSGRTLRRNTVDGNTIADVRGIEGQLAETTMAFVLAPVDGNGTAPEVHFDGKSVPTDPKSRIELIHEWFDDRRQALREASKTPRVGRRRILDLARLQVHTIKGKPNELVLDSSALQFPFELLRIFLKLKRLRQNCLRAAPRLFDHRNQSQTGVEDREHS